MGDDLYEALKGYPPYDELPPQALTRAESLREVIERVRTFVERSLVADLRRRSTVLVVGHGNSLRALCGVLDSLNDAELEELVIPTGEPLLYEFDGHLVPSRRGGTYLDEPAAREAIDRLRNEGGT
jgi:2,3-bisphosphoglycerate-dependent phosphoglycerate mutase